MTSETLDARADARLYFKCENFQRAGVFKARGAFNAVLSLGEAEARRGVVTSSSGNQAAALSLAAQTRGIPAYIAMPKAALQSKVAAVQRYGGHIVWVEATGEVPTSAEYEATADRIRAETGASPVHPYNDPRTIAGQGTCTLEFLEQQPDLDLLLAPVGGGGLISGTALAAKSAATGPACHRLRARDGERRATVPAPGQDRAAAAATYHRGRTAHLARGSHLCADRTLRG